MRPFLQTAAEKLPISRRPRRGAAAIVRPSVSRLVVNFEQTAFVIEFMLQPQPKQRPASDLIYSPHLIEGLLPSLRDTTSERRPTCKFLQCYRESRSSGSCKEQALAFSLR